MPGIQSDREEHAAIVKRRIKTNIISIKSFIISDKLSIRTHGYVITHRATI